MCKERATSPPAAHPSGRLKRASCLQFASYTTLEGSLNSPGLSSPDSTRGVGDPLPCERSEEAASGSRCQGLATLPLGPWAMRELPRDRDHKHSCGNDDLAPCLEKEGSGVGVQTPQR